MFLVDKKLNEDCEYLTDLKLCKLLLKKDSEVPWLILVPKRENIKEIFELEKEDRYLLVDEINNISLLIQKIFKPHKINVGALGNIVSQLHIHIIGRYEDDRAWPSPIWGIPNKDNQKVRLDEKSVQTLLKELSRSLLV